MFVISGSYLGTTLARSSFPEFRKRSTIVPQKQSRPYLWIAAAALVSISLLGCSAQPEKGEAGALRTSQLARCAEPRAAFAAPDRTQTLDYDPWESFNQETFRFNHDVLDRYAIEPVATVWHDAIPYPVRHSLTNAFDNLAVPQRVVNNALQLRFGGALSEVARFLLNTTLGVAGLFDVATPIGLAKSDADTGQTLGAYGLSPGPYVVLPFLPPMTVRDGIGFGVDSLLDPLFFAGLFVPINFVVGLGMAAGSTVNDRAEHLELYQDVEDTALDLYAAVRNGYLQRRQKAVEDATCRR